VPTSFSQWKYVQANAEQLAGAKPGALRALGSIWYPVTPTTVFRAPETNLQIIGLITYRKPEREGFLASVSSLARLPGQSPLAAGNR